MELSTPSCIPLVSPFLESNFRILCHADGESTSPHAQHIRSSGQGQRWEFEILKLFSDSNPRSQCCRVVKASVILDSVGLLCCSPLVGVVPSTVLGNDLIALCMYAASFATHLNARGLDDLRLRSWL